MFFPESKLYAVSNFRSQATIYVTCYVVGVFFNLLDRSMKMVYNKKMFLYDHNSETGTWRRVFAANAIIRLIREEAVSFPLVMFIVTMFVYFLDLPMISANNM